MSLQNLRRYDVQATWAIASALAAAAPFLAAAYLAVSRFDEESDGNAIISDRSWMVAMQAKAGLAERPKSFRFGGAVDPQQLDIWAQAGGVPQAASPFYYQADSAAQLQQALDVIADQTLGCVFQLESTPPDPNAIYVFFNNDTHPIPRDETHQNGWDYDPQTDQVEFYGQYCDDLKDGTVTDVDIVFGCPEPTPD